MTHAGPNLKQLETRFLLIKLFHIIHNRRAQNLQEETKYSKTLISVTHLFSLPWGTKANTQGWKTRALDPPKKPRFLIRCNFPFMLPLTLSVQKSLQYQLTEVILCLQSAKHWLVSSTCKQILEPDNSQEADSSRGSSQVQYDLNTGSLLMLVFCGLQERMICSVLHITPFYHTGSKKKKCFFIKLRRTQQYLGQETSISTFWKVITTCIYHFHRALTKSILQNNTTFPLPVSLCPACQAGQPPSPWAKALTWNISAGSWEDESLLCFSWQQNRLASHCPPHPRLYCTTLQRCTTQAHLQGPTHLSDYGLKWKTHSQYHKYGQEPKKSQRRCRPCAVEEKHSQSAQKETCFEQHLLE